MERQEGSFERQVEIFEPVNFAKATARLERGLLCVELPRVEDRRQRHFVLAVEEPAENGQSCQPVSDDVVHDEDNGSAAASQGRNENGGPQRPVLRQRLSDQVGGNTQQAGIVDL